MVIGGVIMIGGCDSDSTPNKNGGVGKISSRPFHRHIARRLHRPYPLSSKSAILLILHECLY